MLYFPIEKEDDITNDSLSDMFNRKSFLWDDTIVRENERYFLHRFDCRNVKVCFRKIFKAKVQNIPIIEDETADEEEDYDALVEDRLDRLLEALS